MANNVQELSVKVVIDNKQATKGAVDFKNILGSMSKVGLVAFTAVASASVLLANKIKNMALDTFNVSEQFRKATISVQVLGQNMGKSQKEIDTWNDRAKELSVTMGQSLGGSVEQLRTLMKGGMNVDKATALLKSFQDEAMTASDTTMTLEQRVGNLVQMYALEMSALGNKAGLEENVNNMIKKGYAIMAKSDKAYQNKIKSIEKEGKAHGKNKNEITKEINAYKESVREQAKYTGFMSVTSKSAGLYEKSLSSLEKAQIKYNYAVLNAKLAIGNALSPVIMKLGESILPTVQRSVEYLGNAIVDIIGKLKVWWSTNSTNIIPMLGSLATKFQTLAGKIIGAKNPLSITQSELDRFMNNTVKGAIKMIGKLADAISAFVDILRSPEVQIPLAVFAKTIELVAMAIERLYTAIEKMNPNKLKLIIGSISGISPMAGVVSVARGIGNMSRAGSIMGGSASSTTNKSVKTTVNIKNTYNISGSSGGKISNAISKENKKLYPSLSNWANTPALRAL